MKEDEKKGGNALHFPKTKVAEDHKDWIEDPAVPTDMDCAKPLHVESIKRHHPANNGRGSLGIQISKHKNVADFAFGVKPESEMSGVILSVSDFSNHLVRSIEDYFLKRVLTV